MALMPCFYRDISKMLKIFSDFPMLSSVSLKIGNIEPSRGEKMYGIHNLGKP